MKRLTHGFSLSAQKALSEKEFIALFSIMMSLTALSMDAVLPAFRDMALSLQVADVTRMQWVVSALIGGMVFGELLFGPLSDAIGRKKSILIGVGIYMAGTLVAMGAHSLETLLLGRAIQGFGVAGPKIASRALIRDLHKGARMARIMSYVMVIFILVPMLAPSLGQLVLMVGNWRWIFGALILQATIASLWLILRQPETLLHEARKPLHAGRLVQDALSIFARKEVVCYAMMAGLMFSGLMLYIGLAQSIYQDLYHVGDAFPLYFALMSGGAGIASFTNGRIVVRLGMRRVVSFALKLKFTAAISMLSVCLLFDGVPPMWLFLSIGMVLFFTLGLLFGNVNALAMEPLGKTAGLGSSLVSSSSSLLAVILSVIVGSFYDFSVTPLAVGFTLFTATAYGLFRYADRIKASYGETGE